MDKLLSMLGLCARARKLESGYQAVEIAVKKGSARLVVVENDASEETKRAVSNACGAKNIKVIVVNSSSLGDAIGKPGRKLAAVTDQGFADRICQLHSGNA